MSNDNSNGNGREYSVNLHDGGCTEVRATGYTGPTGQDINPGMTGRPGATEVLADGTVIDRGVTKFNTADFKTTGLRFFSPNGGKTLTIDQVTDQCIVEIPGFGRTSIAAAKRVGLLEADRQGNLTNTADKAQQQAKEADQKQKESSQPTNFANQETNNTLMALDANIGREGTMAVANSVIGHLTSDKHGDIEAAFEHAGKALADRSGIDPAISQQAVVEMVAGYRDAAAAFLNARGVDAEAVFDFASTCSAQVKADLYRRVVLGDGPAALADMVRRMKSKNRR